MDDYFMYKLMENFNFEKKDVEFDETLDNMLNEHYGKNNSSIQYTNEQNGGFNGSRPSDKQRRRGRRKGRRIPDAIIKYTFDRGYQNSTISESNEKREGTEEREEREETEEEREEREERDETEEEREQKHKAGDDGYYGTGYYPTKKKASKKK